jgi:YHS domain-containing protein
MKEADIENSKGGEHLWGFSKHYCPVSLVDSTTLVPGKEEYACCYRARLYTFYSEEDLALFSANPESYESKLKGIKIPEVKMYIYGCQGARRVRKFI